ncbi:MAG TPA: protein phosphatase 2C domain-containing protein [Lacipirellulaceae bacterium]|nr:protein phosphatase 2C domain-containing protein [Lacipirellulaceae bacterium]
MRRTNNQDALAVMLAEDLPTWVERGHLLMVADGMGAHAAGELASKLAVDNIPHSYYKLRDLYPPAALRQAIRDANTTIHNKGQSSIGFQGMGTTCSCLVLLPQGALVAHIGDSRVYRLRGQVLEQLTFDHSLVWEMAAAGQMAQEDVPAYIPKNVITRSLGPHSTVHVDLEGPYNAAAGDVFLLCSDGLSGPISDEELGAILQCLEPAEAAETLVDLANLRGGPDNISIIIAHVDGEIPPKLAQAEIKSPEAAPVDRRIHAAPVWIAAGACLGVMAYCLWHEIWPGAVISAIALAVAVVSAIAFRLSALAGCPQVRPLGGPYGNGPYRKAECSPNGKVVAALADIADKLRAFPEKEPGDWTVDWQPFDSARASAAASAEKGEYRDAVRQYCGAIRDIMRQLREKRPTVDGDSDAV